MAPLETQRPRGALRWSLPPNVPLDGRDDVEGAAEEYIWNASQTLALLGSKDPTRPQQALLADSSLHRHIGARFWARIWLVPALFLVASVCQFILLAPAIFCLALFRAFRTGQGFRGLHWYSPLPVLLFLFGFNLLFEVGNYFAWRYLKDTDPYLGEYFHFPWYWNCLCISQICVRRWQRMAGRSGLRKVAGW